MKPLALSEIQSNEGLQSLHRKRQLSVRKQMSYCYHCADVSEEHGVTFAF